MTCVIGITGPIGCGKSTVAGYLAELGATVIDADLVAREVVAPGEPALEAVVAAFGPGVRLPDGSLDRAELGRIVFSDPAELARLEAIIHPAVRPRIRAAMQAAREHGDPAVAVEAIKLVEGGLADSCDEVWLVICDPDEQLRRLTRRGLSEAEAAARIAAQAGLADRLRPRATRVIDTNGAPTHARARVEAAFRDALEGRRP
jgi:dephospho-CoA kinase